MAPRHRSRAPFQLGLDPAAYTPQGLEAYAKAGKEAELKTEYSRLRREAEDRLRKLGRSEFADSKAYTENVGNFPTLKEIEAKQAHPGDLRDLERHLIDAHRFVMSKASSASGQREIRRENISTLHAHGYSWVNTKNFKQFTDFMEEMRAKGAREEYYMVYGSQELDADDMDQDELKERKSRSEALRARFEEWQREQGTWKPPAPRKKTGRQKSSRKKAPKVPTRRRHSNR